MYYIDESFIYKAKLSIYSKLNGEKNQAVMKGKLPVFTDRLEKRTSDF